MKVLQTSYRLYPHCCNDTHQVAEDLLELLKKKKKKTSNAFGAFKHRQLGSCLVRAAQLPDAIVILNYHDNHYRMGIGEIKIGTTGIWKFK